MVAQSLAQKIIARAAGRDEVVPGEFVLVTPDYTVMCDIFWLKNMEHMEKIGVDRFARPDKVIAVIDHTTSAAIEPPYYKAHTSMKEFAKRTGFSNLFGVGSGLRHSVMVEEGFARPGLLVFSDERNLSAIGAVGSLNIAVSWEVLTTMVLDGNWVAVPESARIELVGSFPFGVLVRDLVQAINRDLGPSNSLLQKCVEYGGPALEQLPIDDRMALLSSAYHAGADTAITNPDDTMLDYVEQRSNGRPYYDFTSDEDAVYAVDATFDLSALAPYVTVPPHQHTVEEAQSITGIPVDQATIGSCASNRLEDLRAAATVLEGRKVDPRVAMYITPGSQNIYSAAAAEGLLRTFSDAGAIVLPPGCTTCWGYQGVLDDGQVSISTHQENYRGRNGSRTADVYLASPYTVAASAIRGVITDPRDLLQERVTA